MNQQRHRSAKSATWNFRAFARVSNLLTVVQVLTVGLAHAEVRSNPPVAATFLDQGYGIVRLKSHYSGVGVWVYVNDQVCILTNSHILADRDNAEFETTSFFGRVEETIAGSQTLHVENTKLKSTAQLKWNSSILDLALLIPDPQQLAAQPRWFQQQIRSSAQSQLCLLSRSCKEKYLGRGDAMESLEPQIVTFGSRTKLDGRTTEILPIPVVGPWKPLAISDDIISGIYDHIGKLPLFARAGMSGSPFYTQGLFSGLLTQVDLSGSLASYVIPKDQIEKFLTIALKSQSSSREIPSSNWIVSPDGLGIQVSWNGHNYEQKNLASNIGWSGGDTGHGGGDTGHGSGDPSDVTRPPFWKIQISEMALNTRWIEIANPFHHPKVQGVWKDSLKIEWIMESNFRLQSPSVARLIHLDRNRKKYSVCQDGYAEEVSCAEKLNLARIKNAEPFRFGRAYMGFKEGSFVSLMKGLESPNDDGAVSFYPMPPAQLNPAVKGFVAEIERLLVRPRGRRLGADGYYEGAEFFRARAVPLEDDFMELWMVGSGGGRLHFKKDFGSIDFVGADLNLRPSTVPEASTSLWKNQSPNSSLSRMLYADDQQVVRAIVSFAQDDLSKIERAFVWLPPLMYELVVCSPGETCWR